MASSERLEVIHFFLHSYNMYWLKIMWRAQCKAPGKNEHLKASFLGNCYSTSAHRRKEFNESCISSFFLKNRSLYFSGKFKRHLELCSNSVGTHCAEVDVFHESRWFFSATLSQADNWLLWRHLFMSGTWRLGINRFGCEYWMSVKTLTS